MTLSARIRKARWLTFCLFLVPLFVIGPMASAQDATPPADTEIATQLPAADLPSMNEQGFLYEFDSNWEGSFDSVPTEAPVYRMDVPVYDAESFTAFASRLGIQGDIQDQGDGNWEAAGEAGTLYSSTGFSQFISAASIPEGDLPNDEEAIASAREWLRQTGNLPADAGEGTIAARVEDPARVIVSIQPARPEHLISAYPNIIVTMGPNAVVLESSFRWHDLTVEDTYLLTPVETAWQQVQERRSFLQTDIPAGISEPGTVVPGSATYNEVVVAYTNSGIVGETQFLQPVYVFTGTVRVEGSDQVYPTRAYVPALVNSQQPVG